MVKGKKKVKKKKKVSTEKEIKKIEKMIGVDGEKAYVPEGVEKKENKTLIWFFVVVGVFFAAVLIPYFWIESSKSFEFGHIDWVVEDYEELRIFHGRFLSFTNENLYYNVFLRKDPRENNISVEGSLDNFKFGGIISFSPEVDSCRGDLSRAMLDLGSFLKQGVGVGVLETAYTDVNLSKERKTPTVTCDDFLNRTVVVVDIGDERIVQDSENPSCYTIYASNCEDSAVVEKFIVKVVDDFRTANPLV